MASGDHIQFDQFLVDRDEKVHNFETDEFKMGLITSATTPAATTPGPHFNGTGTTDLSANEVTGGTEYVAGGKVMANPSATLVSAKSVVDVDNVLWALDASGPINARWGIIYNNTDANKRAVGYVDLGQDLSLQAAAIDIQVNSNGLFSTERL